MFDFFREFGMSADEKRIEVLSAYLDGALSGSEREQLEQQLQLDAAMRADLQQMQLVREQLRAMPRRRVPRSFTLDPALYSPPKPQRSQQVYPLLRGATALAAFLFVFVLGLSLLNFSPAGDAAPAQVITMAESEEALLAPQEESAASELAQEAPLAEEAAAPEAAIVIEEPPNEEMAAGGAAETAPAESLALEQANPAESADEAVESEEEAADNSTLREFDSTGGVTATLSADALEGYATGEAVVADTEALTAAVEADAAPAQETSLSYGAIAAWLGIATLALGALTLLLRGRSEI